MAKVSDFLERLSPQVKALYARLQIKEKYIELYDSPLGEEVLRDWIRRTGVLSVSQRRTPEETAYYEGRRSMGLELLSLLRKGNEAEVLKIAMERNAPDQAERYFREHFDTEKSA